MRSRVLLVVLMMVLALSMVSAGSITTSSLNPSSVDLCGSSPQYATLTAQGITNNENYTLNNVQATLYITGDSGLSFITSQTVSLGSISASSQSASTPSWTIQCSSPNAGIYTAYVNYTYTSGKSSSLGEADSQVNIHEDSAFAANITLVEGSTSVNDDVKVIADNTPTIVIETSRDSLCKGSLDNGKAYDDMDFIFYGTQRLHNYTFINPISDGQHTIFAKCKDDSNNIRDLQVHFSIDTQPPQITVNSPGSTIVGDYAELKVTTNEDSVCRYDDHDTSFSSMEEFDVESENIFSTGFSNLDEDLYTYYVKCKDPVGNIGTRQVSFEVVHPPKINIYFEVDPPLSAGLYELTVLPSKELREAPLLEYHFTDDPSKSWRIPLVKDGSLYRGHIIIDSYDKIRAGVFSFEGYDLEGNKGEEIDDGAGFIVDTIKPIAPGSIDAAATDKGISLEWYYEGERPDHFNVYRSTSSGVGYIHLYDTTKEEKYLDENIQDQRLYYYKVAAVDSAGNIGVLSQEVSEYATTGTASQVTISENSNPPTAQTSKERDDLLKDMDSLEIDLGWVTDNLNELSTKNSFVEKYSLMKTVTSNKETLDHLNTQFVNVDMDTITDADLQKMIDDDKSKIALIRKSTPKGVTVIDTSESLQTLSDADIDAAVEEFLKTGNYTDSEKRSYRSKIKGLNENVKVDTILTSLEFDYLDDRKVQKMDVEKTFWYDNPEELDDTYAVEVIPKTVAGDISNVDLRSPGGTVLNQDPVVSWHFDVLNYEKKTITYAIDSDIDLETAKTSKTVILLNPLSVIKKSGILTGFSVFINNIKETGFEIFGVLIGIFVVLGLAMYYLVVMNDIDPRQFIDRLRKKETKEKEQERPAQKVEVTQAAPVLEKAAPAIHLNNYFQRALSVSPEQYFHARNGDVIRHIGEMAEVISSMDDFTYYYHADGKNNDFAEWARAIYGEQVSEMIGSAADRDELVKVINKIIGA